MMTKKLEQRFIQMLITKEGIFINMLQSNGFAGTCITLGLILTLFLCSIAGILSSQNRLEGSDLSSDSDQSSSSPQDEGEENLTPPQAGVETETETASPAPIYGADQSTEVSLLRSDGSVEALSLADYLWGVVAAEMPATFPLEALKAQTVAARTYTTRRLENPRHADGAICDYSGCCQAYIDRDDRLSTWGSMADQYQTLLAEAVSQTEGLHVLYEDMPIDAVFFSSSSGQTLNAVEVWGNSTPYLLGVTSPEGVDVPNYHSQVSYTTAEVTTLLTQTYPQVSLSASPEDWFAQRVSDSAGGVAQITIGGVTLTGNQLRSLFGLRSSFFTVSYDSGVFLFSVTGYGHNVGMSQYGAKAMADQGATFDQILTWYYSNTTLGGIT